MSRSIWSTLGLAATRDIGEIKRAYAAKLKAMDIDANPAAFQSLREARDVAIRLAEQQFDSDPFDDAEQLKEEAIETGAAEAPPIEADSALEPPDPETVELNQHHDALCAILFDMHGDQFYAATPEEEQAMLRHFEAIAASPVVQNVNTLANASNWFAGAIAQMTPRSDVLIEPASRLFGWDRADELTDDAALSAVMHRRADLRFREELSHPSHRLHGAWKELITPADENSRRGWQRRKNILELLAKVRSDHPTLERQMDWYRISLWENQAWWQQGQNHGWILILIIAAIRVAAAVADFESEPSTSQGPSPPASYMQPQSIPLTTSERDIDLAIRHVTGDRITGDRLRRENVGLYQLAHGHWLMIQSEGGDLGKFSERFDGLINDRLPDVWAYADGDLLREYFELRRDIGQSLARTSVDACIAYFRDGTRQLLPQQRERDDEVKAKAILQIDADRPLNQDSSTTFTYRIPGEVVGKVRKATGLDADALRRAWDFKGDKPTQCKAQLALFDTILDQPPAARTKILRDMAS